MSTIQNFHSTTTYFCQSILCLLCKLQIWWHSLLSSESLCGVMELESRRHASCTSRITCYSRLDNYCMNCSHVDLPLCLCIIRCLGWATVHFQCHLLKHARAAVLITMGMIYDHIIQKTCNWVSWVQWTIQHLKFFTGSAIDECSRLCGSKWLLMDALCGLSYLKVSLLDSSN